MRKTFTALGVALAMLGTAGVAFGLYLVVVDPDEEQKLIGAGIAVVSAAILAAIVAVRRSFSHR
jgi:hypothetical protein